VKAVRATRLFDGHELFGLEVFDFAADLAVELAWCRSEFTGPIPPLAGEQILPKRFQLTAQRREHPNTRDDYPSSLMTC